MICPYCDGDYEDVERLPEHSILWDDGTESVCLGSNEIPAPDNGEGGFGLNDFDY